MAAAAAAASLYLQVHCSVNRWGGHGKGGEVVVGSGCPVEGQKRRAGRPPAQASIVGVWVEIHRSSTSSVVITCGRL
ncbi:hypothetical protein SDJN02_13918, partial [Cucurbita argyrosperma subsp. argyrosperma]